MQRKSEFHLSHPGVTGLSYCFCGYHDCPSGYAYGPTIRNEYVLHFVNRGVGFYQIDKRTFRLFQGSSFLLFPGHVLHYQADRADPWEYYWVAFEGKEAQGVLETVGLRPSNPVVVHQDPDGLRERFRQILSCAAERSFRADLRTVAQFYGILDCVVSDTSARKTTAEGAEMADDSNEQIRRAVAFIQENCFDSDLSVNKIARAACLERSYLSTLFREHVGMPPHRFLVTLRIENARRMLSDSSVSIKKVAYSVGFREQGYFDKVFRKLVGRSPTEYRESVREAQAAEGGGPSIPEWLDRPFVS